MRAKLSIAAVLLWLALAVYPVSLSEDVALLVVPALSLPMLIVALVAPRTVAGVLTAALLAVEYAAALLAAPLEVDYAAPAVAVAWFLLLELFDQVALTAGEGLIELRVRWRRMVELLLFVVVGGAGALFAFVLSLIVRGSGPVGAAVATVFGLLALALPLRLAAAGKDGR
ncbi:MAG: hypothetical protein ACRDJS_00260 [Actinomycetota bacterium]|jgi:hypothetical protein